MHKERHAVGMEIIGYTVSSTDEHRSRRIACDMDKNALLWLIIYCPAGTRLRDPRKLKRASLIVCGLS